MWNVNAFAAFASALAAAVLIETLWNVNECSTQVTVMYGARINRNIVECKVAEPVYIPAKDMALIETLWNVKKAMSASVTISDVVLIETLWNVKKLYRMIKKRKVSLYKEERNYGR